MAKQAEPDVEAQRAGDGPPPPATAGQLPAHQAALDALVATAAAARVAQAAPPSVAPQLTVAAVNAAAAGILGSFDAFLHRRRQHQEVHVNDLLEAEMPDMPEPQRIQLVSDELDAERQFSMKLRQRLDRDLPKALSITDPGVREAEVQKILDRERRYVEQREHAMAIRTLGAAEQRLVEQQSPQGGFWRLSPHVKEHTLDCLAMAGKVWPHSVLRTYHPPLHGGCPCEILTIQEAERQGLLHSPDQYATPDQSIQAMSIVEADVDREDFEAELAVLEAFYDERWSTGTTRGGQFRPQRGGDPGAVLRHRRLARIRLPSAEIAPVKRVGRELDVRDLHVASIREGDHVMVNGSLEQVTKVHPDTPGLFDLEHTGLVHIDREHIRGIPGERASGETKKAKHLAPGDRFEKWGHHFSVVENEPGTGGRGRSILARSESGEHVIMPMKATDELPFHGTGPIPDKHGLPELPTYGPNDRFELRHGANGSLIMWDREKNKPHAIWDHGWDLEAVKQGVAQDNEGHRQQLAKREPPPPSPTGGVSFADVEKQLLARKMGKVGEPGPILPGFHYTGPSEGGKVSYKHELQGDTLHLQQGFFRQGRDRREAIVFKHYGSRLAHTLGEQGIQKLGERDSHLADRQRLIDTYFALNTPHRDRMVDLHPDAARLVAQVAHEQGLPLHPEAAKLVRRPTAEQGPPSEHPAHAFAKRQVGLSGSESQSMLREAGYDYGGSQQHPDGTVTHHFHNHELGAMISTRHQLEGTSGMPVTEAHAVVSEPVPEDERQALTGQSEAQAIDQMREQGFSPGYTTSGDWLRFVHPDGRGRALKLERNRDEVGQHVADVKAFTPTDKDVADARAVVIRTNPLGAVKPGDSPDAVVNALHAPASGWRMTESKNRDETTTPLPEGVEGFTEFTSTRNPHEKIVLHTRKGDKGRLELVNIGHGSLVHTGRIVSAGEHEVETKAKKDAEEKAGLEEATKRAAREQALTTAIESGDQVALEAALKESYTTNDAVRALREYDFELRASRRSRRGGSSTITYTMRGPNGETVKIKGAYAFGHGKIDKVEFTGNPQGNKRQRLPEGTAPKNLNQLLVDALGRADELGQRYDAGVHVSAIVQSGVSRGAAAHHEWNGTIAIRQRHEAKEISAYLKKRNAGEPLSDHEHLAFYNALQIIQHELNHGIGKRGSGPGGLAFTQQHYRGVGKNVEEALTEETAHPLAAEWLRSHGMTDVLAALKRNPQSYQALGTYQEYRAQLRRILDDANVPQGERLALLERMKFQMTPEERNAELARLAGTDSVTKAMFGPASREHAERMRRLRGSEFEPIVRPDLEDINADTPSFTTKFTARVVREGEGVSIPDGDTVLHGVVTGIRDGEVKVRTLDGVEMWYSQDRVR